MQPGKSFVARQRGSLVWMTFVAVFVLGASGVGVVGLVAPRNLTSGVLLANVLFVLTGASLCALGIRALRDPTALQLVDASPDAFGETHYSNPRQATVDQSTRIGVVSLVVGLLLALVGPLAGPIAQSLGIPLG